MLLVSLHMHSTRISTLIAFTLALLILCPSPVKNQCRRVRESVVRIRPLTPRLPISEVKDFRVQAFKSQPLLLLAAQVRASKLKDAGVFLTVQNVGSQSISYFEYGVSSCPDAGRGADIVIDNGRQRMLGRQRSASYKAPNDDELEALVKAATLSSCKPLLTLQYVEFKDGTCWRPNIEAIL